MSMNTSVQISKLNDFLFCPNSLYLHSIYDSFDSTTFKQTPQVVGKASHTNIDKGIYSSSKRYLQGLSVYSERYGISGKIDIYDRREKALIERKYKIKKIYDGYKMQLYAQYFCLEEAGYAITTMYLHSLSDNKRYAVEIPNRKETRKFEKLVHDMLHFYIEENHIDQSYKKCSNCIYNTLCHYAKSS